MTIAVTTPAAVKAALAAGEPVFLLDVREPDEVAAVLPGRHLHPARGAHGAIR